MFFKVGGPKFLEVKNGASVPAVALARRRGVCEGECAPLRSWSFFENVGLNEAIWCTIFHHVKHLTACLLGCFFFFFTLQQDGQKSGGAMPPSLKSGGATGPLAPPSSATYAQNLKTFIESQCFSFFLSVFFFNVFCFISPKNNPQKCQLELWVSFIWINYDDIGNDTCTQRKV